MKKALFTLIAMLAFASTSLATPVTLHVDTYGNDDGWTGIFEQMQFFANTTTVQYGDPTLGPVPQIGDTFLDSGNLNITSFTGLTGDTEGLGVAGSTGTAYSLTATWNNVGGYVAESGTIGSRIYQSTVYTSGTFYFYIDADVDQSFGSTIYADDDTNFGADANAELVAILQLVNGTGDNTFSASTGAFLSGSSKIKTQFTWLKEDFWYDGSTTPPIDLSEYFIDLSWDIYADVDQNTDNLAITPIMANGQLFKIGSDHDGSIDFSVVPEPSTFLLLGAGLVGIGFISRRKRN